MMPHGSHRRTKWQIFRWPLIMALATTVGLITALLGDSWYDVVSWVLLGATIVVMGVAWWRSPRGSA